MTTAFPDPEPRTMGKERLKDPSLRRLLDKTLPLPEAMRTAGLLFGEGASLGLFAWSTLSKSVLDYALQNDLAPSERKILLGLMLGGGASVCLVSAIFLAFARENAGQRLARAAVRSSPLLFAGLVPLLFHWQVWASRELTFGVLVCVCGFALHASVLASLQVAPSPGRVSAAVRRLTGHALARSASWAPPLLVVLGGLYYAAFFGYETILHHRSLETMSYDLGLEDNLLWNLIHGGPFMKASPPFGPTGSHFGYHATLFAYVIGPFYALYQHAEALLAFQAFMIGAAALPLYLFAARHIGRWPACLVALAYLLYPPVHGANLYDFHYPPLGVFFIWLTLWLVDSGRNRWAVLGVILTLSVREDIAADLSIMGTYLIFNGRARAGAVVAAVAGSYFLAMKMAIMPHFLHGGESFLNQWEGLVGKGSRGYAGVVETVIGNPVFTLTSLLEPEKFLYLVQLAAPLCFFPWRRPIGYLMSLPGFFFTLLGTHYLPLVQISFQYTAHWTVFLFVALVANLEWIRQPKFAGDEQGWIRQRAWLVTLCALTLVTSYQYGAIFQQHTARGGFGPYEFGRSEEAAANYRKLYSLIQKVPPRAKISSSEMIVPQISNRPDSYTLRQGIFDADYLLFQMPVREDERREARSALEGQFGVIAVEGPFVLAKRGAPKTENEKTLKRLH